jgi:hypothetical protein
VCQDPKRKRSRRISCVTKRVLRNRTDTSMMWAVGPSLGRGSLYSASGHMATPHQIFRNPRGFRKFYAPAPALGQARAISIVTGGKGSAYKRARRPKRRSVTAMRGPFSPEPSVTAVLLRLLSFTGLGGPDPRPKSGVSLPLRFFVCGVVDRASLCFSASGLARTSRDGHSCH